jgi:hypothetical protein
VNVWLLCAHPVMTSISLHTGRPNCRYKVCYERGFYVSADFLFSNFEDLKSRFFTFASFRTTRYVLKGFGWLEFSKRVRNWNKVKNFIYVGSKLQLFQLELPIFIYKFMCQSSLINSVSFLFCEFYRLAKWNEGKTINLIR